MLIRTNLCWELAENYKPRLGKGPFVLGGILLLIGGGFYWYSLNEQAAPLRSTVKIEEAKAKAENQKLEAARLASAEIELKAKNRNVVINYAKARLAWAPVFEELFTVIPSGIEIASLRAFSVGPVCHITIMGSAAAVQPRLECDKFRILLNNSFASFGLSVDATFEKLVNSDRKIQIMGEEQPVSDFVIKLVVTSKTAKTNGI